MLKTVERYGLNVLLQMGWDEVQQYASDQLKYAAIHERPQPLSNVTNPFITSFERNLVLSRLGSKIERDAQMTATLGLSNRQLGEFVDYLSYMYSIRRNLPPELQTPAIDYNSRTFYLLDPVGLHNPITPQGEYIITGQRYHPRTVVNLETGARLEFGPRDGNNIVRFGVYEEDPATLAWVAGYIDKPEDPVASLVKDPDQSVLIQTEEQFLRLLNLIEIGTINPQNVRTDQLVVDWTTDDEIKQIIQEAQLPDEVKARLLAYRVKPFEFLPSEEARQQQEAARTKRAQEIIKKYSALISPELPPDLNRLVSGIIHDHAWGIRLGGVMDLAQFIRSVKPDKTVEQLACDYITRQYPQWADLIRNILTIRINQSPGSKESGISAGVNYSAVREFMVGQRGGSIQYPEYRIIEINGQQFAINSLDEIYHVLSDGNFGAKLPRF